MLGLIDTLVRGARARSEGRVRDAFAIDIIEQKVRDADASVRAAKDTLAGLMLRQRREARALADVKVRIADLEARAVAALRSERTELADEAAGALAELENERDARSETERRLRDRIERMRLSVEKAQRRLIALRQGASTARAVDAERRAQLRLNRDLEVRDDFAEAEAMIARVMDRDDPLEAADIRREIDRDLDGEGVADRLAEAGFGEPRRRTAASVLDRLREKAAATD